MIFENFRIALRAIMANKLRSFLTTLGIIIGVAAVIAVVAIVQGLNFLIAEQLQGVGATFLRVVPRFAMFDPDLAGREVTLTYDDGLAIMEQVPSLRCFNPVFIGSSRVHFGNQAETITVLGVGEHHQEVANHWVERGRFFSRLDIDRHAKVCLIGTSVIEDLELPENPLGLELTVGDSALTVVGIMESKGEMFGQDQDKLLLIPITTAIDMYGRESAKRLVLQFQATDADSVERAKDDITRVLRHRHHIPQGKKDDFEVQLQSEILEATGSILGGVTKVVAGVVGVSLLVGGIGIMNIMLVSVTERTREIGIRKAVGARRTDVMVQFLIEAVTLSLLGGAVGILCGWGLGALVAKLIPGFPAAHVPIWAVGLGFGFSSLVGIFFGTWPAAKAAGLDPIQALRYE